MARSETTRPALSGQLARQQGERLGRAYLDFGEPLPLRSACRRCAPTSRAPAARSNGSRRMSSTDQPRHRLPHRGGRSGPAGRGPLVVHQARCWRRSPFSQRCLAGGGRRRSDRSLDDPVDAASDGCFRRGGECRRGHRAVWDRKRTSTWWRRLPQHRDPYPGRSGRRRVGVGGETQGTLTRGAVSPATVMGTLSFALLSSSSCFLAVPSLRKTSQTSTADQVGGRHLKPTAAAMCGACWDRPMCCWPAWCCGRFSMPTGIADRLAPQADFRRGRVSGRVSTGRQSSGSCSAISPAPPSPGRWAVQDRTAPGSSRAGRRCQ